MTKPQRLPPEITQPIDLSESRTAHVVVGAFVGAIVGGMRIASVQHLFGRNVGIALIAVTLGGALVGLELHATRSWSERGELAFFGRWALACVSAGLTIGSALHFLGYVSREDYYLILFGALMFGVIIGVRLLNIRGKAETRNYRSWRRSRGHPDE
jgi:hypothetical protein